MATERVRTLILGGGMSGLSCAYHLKKDYKLVERSDEPGGLSRSIHQDGFVFDHTGHLLHLRNPYTLKLIPKLLGKNLALHTRKASIYSHHTSTPYPYQANLYGLPHRVIRECLKGLVDAQLAAKGPGDEIPESIKNWVLRTFGKGFAKHFFFPYNEKLWTVSPEILTAEWVAPFVPKPSLAETMEAALTPQDKAYGYNATFYYPKQGGIQALAFAFAKNLNGVELKTEVSKVDLDRHEVSMSDGRVIGYDHLVTTLPLVRFLKMLATMPSDARADADLLRWSSVYDLNLGIRRANVSGQHWIYFPEKKYRFYRVGFPMNFSENMTPAGCSSLYVEIAYQPGHPPDDAQALKDTMRGLLDSGLLRKEDEIVTKNILHIPIAYVTYDKNRTSSTHRLLKYLDDRHVQSIGRFGGWKYSYMEEAILEGKAAAERILGA